MRFKLQLGKRGTCKISNLFITKEIEKKYDCNSYKRKWWKIWVMKKYWFSICSQHTGKKTPGCHLCKVGEWIPMWKINLSSLFFKLFPKLWQFWASRKNNK